MDLVRGTHVSVGCVGREGEGDEGLRGGEGF